MVLGGCFGAVLSFRPHDIGNGEYRSCNILCSSPGFADFPYDFLLPALAFADKFKSHCLGNHKQKCNESYGDQFHEKGTAEAFADAVEWGVG